MAEKDWRNALEAYRQASNALESNDADYERTKAYIDEKIAECVAQLKK